MKKKVKFPLMVTLLFLCIIGFFIFPAKAGIYEAWQIKSHDSGNRVSRVDMQGDAVYEDKSGYAEFALWLYGKIKYFSYSNRIRINIYYTTYYKTQYIWPSSSVYYSWDTPPQDLIEWAGTDAWDYNYDDTINKNWYWHHVPVWEYCNDGVEDKNPSGSDSSYTTNSEDGIYRYLGWAQSFRSGHWHEFQALMKLHIDNAEAEKWDNGIVEEGPNYIRVKSIEQIRVKLVIKLQYELFGWKTLNTDTYIMGDGTPSGDLSSIPLVLGTVIGLP